MIDWPKQQTQGRWCPTCRRDLGPSAPEGLCLACLLLAGLPEEENGPPVAPWPQVNPAAGAPRFFGDYELLREMGRGGMGVVYEARQFGTQRVVALKLLATGAHATRETIQRLHTEAQAAARLDHPNIVAVYETGQHDGHYFLALRFLSGGTLAQRISPGGSRFSHQEVAVILSTIAKAVHYAHVRGVLHRDLKPSNILLDESGAPYVADFGLARLTDFEGDLTLSGAVLGTAGYLAPEIAVGGATRATTASDIYALGSILYELLTGRAPFAAESLPALLKKISEVEPVAPRTWTATVPRDLETICLKCLEKAPRQRYATAEELADELGRFLDDEPIQARAINRTERAWRWSKRNPAVATSIGLLLALLLVLGIGGPLAAYRINQARRAERNERQRAQVEAQLARRSAYASDMLLAFRAWEENNRGAVRDLLVKHRPAIPANGAGSTVPRAEEDLRGWEWRYLWNETLSEELFTLGSEANALSLVAWSPDGARIATTSAERGTNSTRVKIWSVLERREVDSFKIAGKVSELRFRDRAGLLAVSCVDLAVHVWESTTGRLIEVPTAPGAVGTATLALDGRTLAATGKDWVGVWDLATQRIITNIQPPGILIANDRALALSPDGQRLAFNNFLGTFANSQILVADSGTGAILATLEGHRDRIEQLVFAPDGRTLASGSFDGAVILWDLETHQARRELSGHHAPVEALCFSQDGRLLATGGADQQVLLWEVASRKQVGRLQGHTQALSSMIFSPDGQRLTTASRDGTVRVWRTVGPPAAPGSKPNEPLAFSSGFTPSGELFRTFDGRGTVRVWDPRNLSVTATFETPSDSGQTVAWGAGGVYANQLTNNHVGIYRSRPFAKLNDLGERTNTVRALVFSRDAKLLAVARDTWPQHASYTIGVWDWAANKEMAQLGVRAQRVAEMAFSPAAERLAIGYEYGSVEVWDWAGRKLRQTIDAQPAVANLLLFLTDGQRLVIGSTTSPILRILDLPSQSETARLFGQLTAYGSVAESRDGRRLAAGGADGTITLWDLQTYAQVASLHGHQDGILTLAFLPDHNTLTSVSRESMRTWRAAALEEADSQ